MRLTLEAAGYEVGEARDGADGVRLFGDGSEWSVIVLDQRMAGMDGLETLRQLKNKNPGARLVMATAYASIELAVDAMKLGATDFVRKPMTPEVLRNSIAAALSKSPVETTGTLSAPAVPPLIQTITMNGFTILDDTPAFEEHQRRFVVISPDGQKHEVVVEIQNEPIEYVRRITGRYLAADSSFWTAQARRLLSDFVWDEGRVPPMHRLVMQSLDSDRVLVAARWKA